MRFRFQISRILVFIAAAAWPAMTAADGSLDTHPLPVPAQFAAGHTVLIVNGAERTFDFAARSQADGSASGFARLHNEANGLTLSLAIDCLVIDGNLARVGGKVTHSNSSGLIGANVLFHAEDNGEQPSDPPDRVSFGFITTTSCETFVIPPGHPGGLAALARGNVQIVD